MYYLCIMEQKLKRGAKPLPKGEKKLMCWFYLKESHIEQLGGKLLVQQEATDYFIKKVSGSKEQASKSEE